MTPIVLEKQPTEQVEQAELRIRTMRAVFGSNQKVWKLCVWIGLEKKI